MNDKINIDELKKTAHQALDKLIDQMVERHPIQCPNIRFITYDDDGDPITLMYEILELEDGTWSIQE